MPLDDQQLVVEPNYPKAKELMLMGREFRGVDIDAEAEKKYAKATIRNRWFSDLYRCDILIWELDGKIEWGKQARMHGFPMQLGTLGAADAWGIEQEHNALQTLGEMVKHRAFKQYLLTGMFLETSPRSGLTYCFRRLRPTVVLTTRNPKHPGEIAILTTLCLHPIAYYAGTWGGAMCPTDDVIAHLALMRGDEHMLWRRANQHDAITPESGL